MDKQKEKPLVKSKQRIADHGEVFTDSKEVKAMVDLVDQSASHPETLILEPACGDGNFLSEILQRRLNYMASKWGKPAQRLEYEKQWILSLSTLYGVELQEDNVKDCRIRLLKMAWEAYRSLFKRSSDMNVINAGAAVLESNILHGDALKLTSPHEPFEPLHFTQWSFAGARVVRRTFSFAHLLDPKKHGRTLKSDKGHLTHIHEAIETLSPVIWKNLKPEDESITKKITTKTPKKAINNG